MERRIYALKNADLDFNAIREKITENIEHGCQGSRSKARSSQRIRMIKAVAYSMCVCMAAVVLAFVISKTDILVDVPPQYPQAHWTDPGKDSEFAKKYDRFFAFATFVNPNVILNSDLLSKEDKAIFFEHAQKTKGWNYILYMGTNDGKDIITILEWDSENKFEFKSNLPYRYEDIISRFEEVSGSEITNEFLEGSSRLDVLTEGIYLNFKSKGYGYIPYYESAINGKTYTVDPKNDVMSDERFEVKEIVYDMPLSFTAGQGHTTQMDENIAKEFDSFFAFGTLYLSSLYEQFDLLSDQDREDLKEAGHGFAYYEYYLGVKDGVDIVVVRIAYNDTVLTFNSNLDYRYDDVIKELERSSGTKITDDLLSASKFDPSLHRELGGITLFTRFSDNDGEERSALTPYFKAEIDGKIYVIDID